MGHITLVETDPDPRCPGPTASGQMEEQQKRVWEAIRQHSVTVGHYEVLLETKENPEQAKSAMSTQILDVKGTY